jgi:hypothetical protein
MSLSEISDQCLRILSRHLIGCRCATFEPALDKTRNYGIAHIIKHHPGCQRVDAPAATKEINLYLESIGVSVRFQDSDILEIMNQPTLIQQKLHVGEVEVVEVQDTQRYMLLFIAVLLLAIMFGVRDIFKPLEMPQLEEKKFRGPQPVATFN